MIHSEPLLLIILGFLVGTLGTLIGAGGGFIMVPALLILYPSFDADTLTGVSLAIVCCNAISGSIAYAYKKRIDYRSAITFSVAAAPGAFLGAYTTSLIPRKSFEFGFGIVMVLIALYLLLGRDRKEAGVRKQMKHGARVLVDRYGHQHHISYNSTVGIALSVIVGFVSSLLGIGGGIIHVPALVRILDFPVHVATATSHFILAIMALIGVTEHALRGDLIPALNQILWLAPSVMIGAQLGAFLSSKVHGTWIVRGLALALLLAGFRFVF